MGTTELAHLVRERAPGRLHDPAHRRAIAAGHGPLRRARYARPPGALLAGGAVSRDGGAPRVGERGRAPATAVQRAPRATECWGRAPRQRDQEISAAASVERR